MDVSDGLRYLDEDLSMSPQYVNISLTEILNQPLKVIIWNIHFRHISFQVFNTSINLLKKLLKFGPNNLSPRPIIIYGLFIAPTSATNYSSLIFTSPSHIFYQS